jgi:transposase
MSVVASGMSMGRRVLLAAGTTDMRKGFTGLSALVQNALASSPFCGQVFVFRGRRGDLIKMLWWDGTGLCLMAKRLERGRFIWPQARDGSVSLTAAQLSMLLEVNIYAEQIQRWRTPGPSAAQTRELDRLEEQNRRLRAVATDVLALAHELRKGTIDRIMAMSDNRSCEFRLASSGTR